MADDIIRKSVSLTPQTDGLVQKLVDDGIETNYSAALRWCILAAHNKLALVDPRLIEADLTNAAVITGEMASFVRQIAERLGIPTEALLARMVEDSLHTYIQLAEKLESERDLKRKKIAEQMAKLKKEKERD